MYGKNNYTELYIARKNYNFSLLTNSFFAIVTYKVIHRIIPAQQVLNEEVPTEPELLRDQCYAAAFQDSYAHTIASAISIPVVLATASANSTVRPGIQCCMYSIPFNSTNGVPPITKMCGRVIPRVFQDVALNIAAINAVKPIPAATCRSWEPFMPQYSTVG